MKILITGAQGYIGSRLKKYFVDMREQGHFVGEGVGIDIRTGQDILRSDVLPDADVVYHLAAQAGVGPSLKDPFYDARSNIMGTIRIAQRYADKKIIYTTSGAAKDPESPYGLSKRTAEEYLRMLVPDNTVICRLSSVFGQKPRGVVDSFIRSDTPIVYGDGTAVRDFVHVDDIVRGLFMARGWKPGTYEMGSGKGTTIREVAEATGKEVEYREARPGEKHTAVLENETPNWQPEIDVLEYVESTCK